MRNACERIRIISLSFYYRYYHLPGERGNDNFDIRNFSNIALYGVPESTRYLRLRFNVNLAEHLASNGWYEVAFDKEDKKNISDASGKTRVEFHNSDMAEANIAYNRALLLKAIRLCENAGVVPILITTPVFSHTEIISTAMSSSAVQKVIHQLCTETGVKYFNYFDDQRFDVDDFHDNDHLNAHGAEKLAKSSTKRFCRDLRRIHHRTERGFDRLPRNLRAPSAYLNSRQFAKFVSKSFTALVSRAAVSPSWIVGT